MADAAEIAVERPETVPTVTPARRFNTGSILGAAAVLCFVAMVIVTAITDKAFEWPVVAQYFFSDLVLLGLRMTLLLTVLSGAVAVLLGTVLLIGALTYLPALAMGPLVEYLQQH